ncbi:MAG TPA: acyl-CoA desaturase [Nocardioidaceae bacterium]|jgi:fatty acid desaturase|nr:acyl-CoA desaturase [Nocardioidaceae bacterium]
MTVSVASHPVTKQRGSDFAALSKRIKSAGLLERRHGFYAWRMSVTVSLFAAGWVALAVLGHSWWSVAVAAYLAIVSTQLGFLGHDAGHHQIFRTRKPNDVVGLVNANLLTGLSYGWWVTKHNRHHKNPNHEGMDPDISPGALAFTGEDTRARSGLARAVTKYQAWFFFPLLTLEALNLHVASVRALVNGEVRRTAVESVLLAVHLVAYLGGLVLLLSPLQALVFVLVHQGVFGIYLGCSFAPNHKGMPTLTKAQELDFLRRQVLTSRNVRGGWFVDNLLGGLNHQIEHHLFPSMPRPNLGKATDLIKQFCAERDIPFAETTLLDSYAQVLRHLDDAGAGRETPRLAR